MSKYTEDQINEAIEIVQIALKDGEIEYYCGSDKEWFRADEVDFGFDHRAKKKPREFWVAIGEDFFEIEASEKDARNLYDDTVEIIKVREVLE